MGSLFHVPVAVSDQLRQNLEQLRNGGYQTVGAVLDGEDAIDFDWPERVALVIGNEANGVSDDVGSALNHRVSIPSFGRAESLNAAVAFAILAGQWRSRHRPAGK
jgi:TrmH family RNA methyltransferase